MTKTSGIFLSTLLIAGCAFLPAQAQPSSDPNLGHFYMARQQITITDDGPAVNDQRTNPHAAQQNGALPNRPIGLPRAGWQPYSQNIPQLRTTLPKTNNGVPERAPVAPPTPAGLRAKAGGLKPGGAKPKASQPSAPVVKAYSPYKQYEPESAAAGSAMMNSNANVRGSVLHWARPKHNGY